MFRLSDRLFWPTFLTDIFCSIFLLLSSAELSSLENKLRGRSGILSGRKSPFHFWTFKDNLFSHSYLKKNQNWILVNKMIFRLRGYIPPPLKRILQISIWTISIKCQIQTHKDDYLTYRQAWRSSSRSLCLPLGSRGFGRLVDFSIDFTILFLEIAKSISWFFSGSPLKNGTAGSFGCLLAFSHELCMLPKSWKPPQVMCPHSAYLSSFLKIHYTLLRFWQLYKSSTSKSSTFFSSSSYSISFIASSYCRGDGPLPAPIRHLIAILASARWYF